MTNKEIFGSAYRRFLREAVTARPADYAYSIDLVDEVANRMLAGFERGSANKDSTACRKTCKHLGISHTYKAINAFLKGGNDAQD
jgi:hypothetical protein